MGKVKIDKEWESAMTEQSSVQAQNAASAADAPDNSEIGVDGRDPSIAGPETGRSEPDPVTGTMDNAVGEAQAAENQDRDPSS